MKAEGDGGGGRERRRRVRSEGFEGKKRLKKNKEREDAGNYSGGRIS